ncbi:MULTISPECIES: PhzF family phenazine biosynthesis protein [Emticicia]|uniref:PhzF family phenazine biosynthesis protein n=1 Tax=Emticicia TaxID=312278 RepID=UPI0020A1366B|nr:MULTISPECIES: PhzF family phenazine biosynthesis protein [Emticicia]UTA68840.1 PhzF family phenazine biosynthesis protein [Emticicia sp. 21SJ11W-3]
MELDFSIVDVFAEQKYQGNQLAVFRNAGELTDEQMLKIAREINFQETTFILSDEPSDGGYNVRIFTPEYEVPFAGHPTLGTAFVLMGDTGSEITLNLKIGKVPVKPADGILWLELNNPVFGETLYTDLPPLLGIEPTDVDDTLPVQLVSTGLPYLIVPLKTLKAVQQVKPEAAAITQWLIDNQLHKSNSADGLTTAFFVFSPETHAEVNHVHARMLCLENQKIVEDAATGSANSCLLAYLLKHELPVIHKLVEQGYEINRPSLISIKGERTDNEKYKLQVGGKAQLVAQGKWFV